jgi:hypothetical protein
LWQKTDIKALGEKVPPKTQGQKREERGGVANIYLTPKDSNLVK